MPPHPGRVVALVCLVFGAPGCDGGGPAPPGPGVASAERAVGAGEGGPLAFGEALDPVGPAAAPRRAVPPRAAGPGFEVPAGFDPARAASGPCLSFDPPVAHFGTVLVGQRHELDVRIASCHGAPVVLDVAGLLPAPEVAGDLRLDLGPAGLEDVDGLVGGPLALEIGPGSGVVVRLTYAPRAATPPGLDRLARLVAGSSVANYRVRTAVFGRAVAPPK